MAEVAFHEIGKVFPDGTVAVEDFTCTVADGEFMVLVGPSGCGKTTALRIVAGLEQPTTGAIAIGGTVVNGVPPRARDVAMVFQSYALYPHKTVEENLSFGLKMHKVPKEQAAERVKQVSDLLALTELLDRRPGQLSGGQRQRVAMGRALARSPKAFLLDEPLSNLDAQLRTQLRAELKQIHQKFPTTSIYVTHDQIEAMTLGDRIAVMNEGRLLQLGTPNEIYRSPRTLFVAGFIGSPPMNLLQAVASGGEVRAGELTFALPGAPDGELVIGLRPEALRLEGSEDEPTAPVRVEVVEALGHEVVLHGSLRAQQASSQRADRSGLAPLDADRANLVMRFPAGRAVAVGDVVPLRFSARDVHVFDAATGDAVRVGSERAAV
ncbi:MAG TPA: ABC transporter ATP-binding protein [Actinomycetota bacterium]|jgi:sn-glycerol 3-phosphate transport system ATP-binding protein